MIVLSYTHQHIPVVDPEEGYDLLATSYQSYHQKLSAWDAHALQKYMPRSVEHLRVLDLGGGDGRRAKIYASRGVDSRTILDVSEKLLGQAPGWTTRLQVDLTQNWPLSSGSYDLLLCSFVLLHLPTLITTFTEAHRVIAPQGRMLLFHHHERRPRVHKHPITGKPYKITTYHWSFEDIQQELLLTGWDVDIFSIDEVSKLYCCFPRSK